MKTTEQFSAVGARLFVSEDMTKGVSLDVGPGLASVYSSRSPGKVTANEDAAAILSFAETECVLAVADGLGGSRAGHQASRLAVSALKAAVEAGMRNGSDLRDAILNGFESSNTAVLDLGIGAATTLAVVELRNNIVRPYHAGDSLILVVGQRGKVKLQSVSHSPVGYGVESGLLDEREAMYHEERHIVSNVIGTQDMRIEIGSTLELAPRDTMLIASDGLWDNLHSEEIVRTVRKGPLPRAVKALAEKCNLRMLGGGEQAPSKPDDLTFILFRAHFKRRIPS